MATVEANIHAALMARVESMTDFVILWPGIAQPRPAGEHVEVQHSPNASDRRGLSGKAALERRGFLYLAHYAPTGQHETVYKERAGLIAAHFPRDLWMEREGVRMRVHKVDVGRGAEDDGMWRTLVSVDYRGFA